MRSLILAASLAAALGLAQHSASQPEQLPAHQAEHGGGGRTDLWKWINFALLAGALGYFIAKKSGAFFGARSEQIRSGLAEAARLKQEAEARYAETERRLANISADIEQLRRQAREESTAEGDRVRRETERELQKTQAQAEHEISAAAKAARQELRAYSAELAIDLARQKIRRRMTPELDGALVASVAGQLEQRSEAARTS